MQLKSIQGLEQLTKLRRLIVREWTELEELPSMETLTSTLEKLWAEGSVKLKTSAHLGPFFVVADIRESGTIQLTQPDGTIREGWVNVILLKLFIPPPM